MALTKEALLLHSLECWYLTATLNYRMLVPDCATLNYKMLVPDCATLNVIFCTQSFSHRQVLSVERLATGCTVRGSNPGGGEIFRTRPDRLCGPPSPLYNGYRVSFPGGRRPGRGVDHPTPSSDNVQEIIQPYFYPPSAHSWPVVG